MLMKKERLSFFEKRKLKKMAKADSLNNQFQIFETGEVFPTVSPEYNLYSEHALKESLLGTAATDDTVYHLAADAISNDEEIDSSSNSLAETTDSEVEEFLKYRSNLKSINSPKTEDSIPKLVVSSFIRRELQQFNSQRDRIIEKRLCLLKMYYEGKKQARFQFKSFSKCQTILEEKIEDLEASIISLYYDYKNTESSLVEKYIKSIQSGQNHQYLKLYKNQLDAAFSLYYKDAIKKYEGMIRLMDEKIRLMDMMQNRMIAIRARYLLRIFFYFESARKYTPVLPVAPLSENTLIDIGNARALGKYDAILAEDRRKRKELLKLCPPGERIQLEGAINATIGEDLSEGE